MLTVSHLDGDGLVLTHYCIPWKQPVLSEERFDAETGVIQLEFVRATNLGSRNSGHMRRAKYRIIGPDEFETEWKFSEATLDVTR